MQEVLRALKEPSQHVSGIVEQQLNVNVCGLLLDLLQITRLAQVHSNLQLYMQGQSR